MIRWAVRINPNRFRVIEKPDSPNHWIKIILNFYFIFWRSSQFLQYGILSGYCIMRVRLMSCFMPISPQNAQFLIRRVNFFGCAGNKRFKSIYLHNKDALENTGIKYQWSSTLGWWIFREIIVYDARASSWSGNQAMKYNIYSLERT